MKRWIIFCIRKRLHLKKFEAFRFSNQKTTNIYYFNSSALMKIENGTHMLSNVSLNWLLSKECRIIRML